MMLLSTFMRYTKPRTSMRCYRRTHDRVRTFKITRTRAVVARRHSGGRPPEHCYPCAILICNSYTNRGETCVLTSRPRCCSEHSDTGHRAGHATTTTIPRNNIYDTNNHNHNAKTNTTHNKHLHQQQQRTQQQQLLFIPLLTLLHWFTFFSK